MEKKFAAFAASSGEAEVYIVVAQELYRGLESGAFGFDPVTILAIIGLVKTLIDLYIQCKKNDWQIGRAHV